MGNEDVRFKQALLDAHCWEDVDRIPNDDAMTAFKRRARLQQARWREGKGFEIGHQPYAPELPSAGRPIGSRIEFKVAANQKKNLITDAALAAANKRLKAPEPHQTLRSDRLWADLLSSMPMCFNLFGDLDASPEVARRCVRSFWPDAPTGEVHVRFEWSPGRLDPSFLGNRSAFDVAFEITRDQQPVAIIGVETKYHEHAAVEVAPSSERMARYREVTDHSRVFRDGWSDKIIGTRLQQIWLDHLLCVSMLQQSPPRWTWGRFVLVYPRRNVSFAAAADEYRALLSDPGTFEARTIEELIAAPGALPQSTIDAFSERYLWDD